MVGEANGGQGSGQGTAGEESLLFPHQDGTGVDPIGGDGPRAGTLQRPRVDPGQSREMYRHLKLRGEAPVRLVLYPGEGHGNRRAASRYDYSLRSLRWFEHYLKGPGGEAPPPEVEYGSDAEPVPAQAEG